MQAVDRENVISTQLFRSINPLMAGNRRKSIVASTDFSSISHHFSNHLCDAIDFSDVASCIHESVVANLFASSKLAAHNAERHDQQVPVPAESAPARNTCQGRKVKPAALQLEVSGVFRSTSCQWHFPNMSFQSMCSTKFA
jgi:hypothetical protein